VTLRSLPLVLATLLAALALPFTVGGCDKIGIGGEPHPPLMMGPTPLSVTDTFMTEPNAFTPPESAAPLDFALTLAVREGRPTVVLSGRYNLPATARARYGDDPRHAIYVIALNPEAHRLHAAPVGPPLSPTSEPPAFQGDVFADQGSGEPLRGVFSVDLPAALGLPQLSATYQFFLWMDEHVTARQQIVVPTNRTPREGHEVLPITGPAILLQGTDSQLPFPGVTMTPDEGTSVVRGIVAHDRDVPEPIPLLVLAVERPAMRFGYARVVLPNDEDSVRLAYDFDVRHLYFNHQPEGRVWVLGIMAESMGTPVAVRMPERPVVPVTDGGVPAPAAARRLLRQCPQPLLFLRRLRGRSRCASTRSGRCGPRAPLISPRRGVSPGAGAATRRLPRCPAGARCRWRRAPGRPWVPAWRAASRVPWPWGRAWRRACPARASTGAAA
jgi:hypothetical protein